MLSSFYQEGFALIPRRLMTRYKDMNLSAEAFILLLYILDNHQSLNQEASLNQVASHFGWSENLFYDYLAELMENSFVELILSKDAAGKQVDQLSIKPLFDYLEGAYQPRPSQPRTPDLTMDNNEVKAMELVPTFEGEFGRPLTQFELMEIVRWKGEDQFDDAMILFALKQAVLNQAMSFKYMDRILLGWKMKNIRTVQEAQKEADNFNASKAARNNYSQGKVPDDFVPFDLPMLKFEDL